MDTRLGLEAWLENVNPRTRPRRKRSRSAEFAIQNFMNQLHEAQELAASLQKQYADLLKELRRGSLSAALQDR